MAEGLSPAAYPSRVLDLLPFRFLNLSIGYRVAAQDTKVFDVGEQKSGSLLCLRKCDIGKYRTLDFFQNEAGALFFILGEDLVITDFDSLCVANVEAVRGSGAEHGRFRILLFFFWKFEGCILPTPAARMLDENVADGHVFDRMTGNSHKHGTDLR